MATSPDPSRPALPARPQREASCPEHGTYTSVNIIGGVWSRCPACESAARKREADAAVLERLKAQEVHHRAMLDAARIPARFERCSFDNFVVATDDQRHALTVCRDFVENFDEHARSFLALKSKSHGDAALVDAIERCAVEKPIQPVPWLAAALKPKSKPKASRHSGFDTKNYREGITADGYLT